MDILNGILGIIPARMASARFPGKPLVMIGDLPMVIRVYRQVSTVLPHVFIATPDREILETANRYGARSVLTRADHPNGTSRCQEATDIILKKNSLPCEAVINIQGDEPLIDPEAIVDLAREILKPGTDIATLVRVEKERTEVANPNRVKVVTDREGFALYFSRSPLPYSRNTDQASEEWLSHVGIYAFGTGILDKLMRLEPSRLEQTECLEQLRWLENGYRIRCCPTCYEGFGIDTREDLERLLSSGKL